MTWLTEAGSGVVLQVRVTPRSSRHRVDGVLGDALKIRLQAPPVEGKANEALVEFLAEQLDVPRRAVQLEAGAQSRTKRVRIAGLTGAEVQRRLGLG